MVSGEGLRTMAERPDNCPECGAARVAQILYGYDSLYEEADLDAGRVVLGGCVVREDSPQWRCAACGHEWGGGDWIASIESVPPALRDRLRAVFSRARTKET
jgi:hypothetical protein